jgi:antitoxin ParD1/3/4
MNDLTKFLDPETEQWIESRIAECEFASLEEYLAALVRRDREEADEETKWLREQIDIGRASGIIDKEPEEVIEEIIARRHARGG